MDSHDTKFAPAERVSTERILRDVEALRGLILDQQIVHVIPYILMLLNKQRQVVYKNQQLMDLLGVSSDQEVLGKRPGELFGCIHAYENEGGCGTTEFCRECGAVKAILKSQKDKAGVEQECRITSITGGAYDFRVWASPYTFEGKDYTLFGMMDISHEKRRSALERTFFHDIGNILMPLVGFSELLDTSRVPREIAEGIEIIKSSSKELQSEIANHRKLLQAEDGNLSLELAHGISCRELVDQLAEMASQIWPDRPALRRDTSDDLVLTTDRSLFFRILYNMIKNAMEASSPSELISIRCTQEGFSCVFSVHNPNFMPRSTQLQVFQRSFSTKGKGRGIGTYSMKLFGEEYLKGKVWFSTSEEQGMTFFLSVPLSYEVA